jgi:hypothetical protein
MASHLVRPGAAAAAADDAGDHRRLAVHHWRSRRQPRQGPAGHGVQLAHVAPGKRPQERPQGGRRPDPAEHLCHGAVPQDVHVIDVVRPGGHARDQQGIFRPGFTPAGLAIVTCSPARSARPHRWAGAMTGTRPARDTLAGLHGAHAAAVRAAHPRRPARRPLAVHPARRVGRGVAGGRTAADQPAPVRGYAPGSWGPAQARELTAPGHWLLGE